MNEVALTFLKKHVDLVILFLLCGSRDAADLVVQGKGKFEELMVCSHEIAASTAQLVAASKVSKQYMNSPGWVWTPHSPFFGEEYRRKQRLVLPLQVKADKDSSNLHRLQQASRGVTQATAAVVASTKSGKSQIEETGEGITVAGKFLRCLNPQVLKTQKVFEHNLLFVCRNDGLLQHDSHPDQTARDGRTGEPQNKIKYPPLSAA